MSEVSETSCPLEIGTLVEFDSFLRDGAAGRPPSSERPMRGHIVHVEEFGRAGWGYTVLSKTGVEYTRSTKEVRVVSAVEQLGDLTDE